MVVKHKSNAKKLCKIVNEISHRNNDKSSIVSMLTSNGNKVENPTEIGSMFNNHFTTAGQKVINILPIEQKLPKKIKKKSTTKILINYQMFLKRKLQNLFQDYQTKSVADMMATVMY